MNNLTKRLKRKATRKDLMNKNVFNIFIHPFHETPSMGNAGKETSDRINAHDLFLFYTADIIREEVIFSR